MTIAYVCPVLAEHGGVERILIEKMNLLSRMYGYEVCLITYDQGQHPLPFPLDVQVHHVDLGVRTHSQYQYRGFRRLWEGFKLSRLLRQRLAAEIARVKPHVIVATTAGPLSLLMRLKGQTPIVVESHGGYDHLIDYPVLNWHHRLDLRHRYRLLRHADAIVTLTKADAQRWQKHGYTVHVIPNVAHLSSTPPEAKDDRQGALFVGRLAPQKGIPELAAVWRLVVQRHPDWQLHIYGNGDAQPLLGVDGICVHEAVDDVFPCYQASAMLLLTSRWEPFGLVVPEAMSCGLPVVAFETDGPSSMISDGKDGFLVKNRDVQTFANRVCQLIEDPALRCSMGQAAASSSRRYTAKAVMPRWKELFEKSKLVRKS